MSDGSAAILLHFIKIFQESRKVFKMLQDLFAYLNDLNLKIISQYTCKLVAFLKF